MLNPIQPKFLSPLGFRLFIEKIPHVTFFATNIPIPGMSLGTAIVTTPDKDYPVPGEEITFDTLEITFMVDEHMINYLELFDWMTALGFPESASQFDDFQKMENMRLFGNANVNTQSALYSDCVLHILTNNNNENKEIRFVDCFPIGLSKLEFGTTPEEVKYIFCTASFAYSYFKFQ